MNTFANKLLDLWTGRRSELAAELGVSRMGLWYLLTLKHRFPPTKLLTRVATATGIPLADWLTAWERAKRRQRKATAKPPPPVAAD